MTMNQLLSNFSINISNLSRDALIQDFNTFKSTQNACIVKGELYDLCCNCKALELIIPLLIFVGILFLVNIIIFIFQHRKDMIFVLKRIFEAIKK